jgi:iron complex transport system substrate-binding protein
MSTHARPRIVSLAPSATSILVALGARRLLVGVSKWCRDVARVNGLPVVGDCWALDPKQVTRLRPTLVIGSVPFKPATVGELLAEPLTFLAHNPRSLEDIYSDIRLFGAITNRVRASDRVVARMQQDFATIAKRTRRPDGARPRVYCEAWPKPRISSPPWVAELVEIAGGRMAVPAGQRVTDVQVARAAPDIIVLAWTATGDRAKPASALRNPDWHDLPAVRNARVHVVRDEWLNTPAPILVRGARELARLVSQL